MLVAPCLVGRSYPQISSTCWPAHVDVIERTLSVIELCPVPLPQALHRLISDGGDGFLSGYESVPFLDTSFSGQDYLILNSILAHLVSSSRSSKIHLPSRTDLAVIVTSSMNVKKKVHPLLTSRYNSHSFTFQCRWNCHSNVILLYRCLGYCTLRETPSQNM